MIEYKGYLMSGAALMIHPNSPDWRAIGTVCAKTPQGSILEVESIGGPVFTSKEAAEKHGLELCHAWIEEKLGRLNGSTDAQAKVRCEMDTSVQTLSNCKPSATSCDKVVYRYYCVCFVMIAGSLTSAINNGSVPI